MEAYGHVAGNPLECLSLAIQLKKEQVYDRDGNPAFRVGFKIGGGIDQDPSRAPFLYPDTGIYITNVEPDSPAERAGLVKHDKILRVNGVDFTMVTHDRAVKYIQRKPVLHILVARTGIPPLNEVFTTPGQHAQTMQGC
ncbi:unnamed protein product, partial [Mesorhabditis spiculigera]